MKAGSYYLVGSLANIFLGSRILWLIFAVIDILD